MCVFHYRLGLPSITINVMPLRSFPLDIVAGVHTRELRSQALFQLQIPVSAAASHTEANGIKEESDGTAGNEGNAHDASANDSKSNSVSLIDTPIGNGSSNEAAAAGEESRPDARLAKALAALRAKLADSANEASAFATLQQSSGDADRLKRSVSQVTSTLFWSGVGCPGVLQAGPVINATKSAICSAQCAAP